MTVIVLADASRSMPPFAVPPFYPAPGSEGGVACAVGIGRGVNRRNVMSAADTNWPAPTGPGAEAPAARFRTPAPGSVVIFTASSVFAGIVRVGEAEVRRRKAVGRVFQRGDRLIGASGRSLTEVTLTVIVLADASRSMPPFAVPPLSCTWKVKFA